MQQTETVGSPNPSECQVLPVEKLFLFGGEEGVCVPFLSSFSSVVLFGKVLVIFLIDTCYVAQAILKLAT